MMDSLSACSLGQDSLRRASADEATSVRVHCWAARWGAGRTVTGILEARLVRNRRNNNNSNRFLSQFQVCCESGV